MEVGSSTNLQDEYLTLLVTQLQNQDPLDPVSQEDFIGQVTQFSTLSEIETLNTSFEQMVFLQNDLLRLQEVAVSTAMVGQTVEYDDPTLGKQSGTVTGFELAAGRIQLVVDDTRVPVSSIISIS